jgi:pimeloyl-ACP methyl ester carboxylesterase
VPYLRGYHPETIVAGRGYGASEIAEDAVRLLDAVGVERAVLVGHDWGAAVVYRAAALAPSECGRSARLGSRTRACWSDRLDCSGAAGISSRCSCRAVRGWLAATTAYLDTLMRRWAPSWSGPAREETLADVKRCFADPRVLDAALGYYRDASVGADPGALSQPALIVGGTTDLIDAEAFTRSAEAFAGHCEVLIAEGAGHWPHREAAELFNRRLLAFLAGLPS